MLALKRIREAVDLRTLAFTLAVPLLVGLGWFGGLGLQVWRLQSAFPKTTAFQAVAGRPIRKTERPLEELGGPVAAAVVVSEDARFLEHWGFDAREIRASIGDAFEHGQPPRGASTLTQQLAKNLFLGPERTLGRKLKEAAYTVWLEVLLGKRRILELYLNEVELGVAIYGVETAAREYFAKPAKELTWVEAAQLAATLPTPRLARPDHRTPRYDERVERILQRVEEHPTVAAAVDALVFSKVSPPRRTD